MEPGYNLSGEVGMERIEQSVANEANNRSEMPKTCMLQDSEFTCGKYGASKERGIEI